MKIHKIKTIALFVFVAVSFFLIGGLVMYIIAMNYIASINITRNNLPASYPEKTEENINEEPVSYTQELNPELGSDEALSKFGYKAYIVPAATGRLYFSLMYVNKDETKEVFRWNTLNGGIGGQGCSNRVSYSPDGSYFFACAQSAVGVDHGSIPLIFDKDGNLNTDLSKIEGMDIQVGKDYDYVNNKADGIDYVMLKGGISIKWLDNNTLILLLDIYHSELEENSYSSLDLYNFTLGNSALTPRGTWKFPTDWFSRGSYIVNDDRYVVNYMPDVENPEGQYVELSNKDFK